MKNYRLFTEKTNFPKDFEKKYSFVYWTNVFFLKCTLFMESHYNDYKYNTLIINYYY